MLLMKRLLALFLVVPLLAGSGAFRAGVMEKLLIGRWMLYAGGGADIWEFHEDGTCTSTGITFDGDEIIGMHTWRVEKATEEDLKKLWAQPKAVLVIDGEERYGLHLEWEHVETTLRILLGGELMEEERVLTAALPLCISLTDWMGGGGYVRMKDE